MSEETRKQSVSTTTTRGGDPVDGKVRRMGGRSSRVRASVLEHAYALLVEKGPAAFSVAEVAARAGVHETSIYRRWKTKTALALDACLNFAAHTLAIPDTGSLRSDLIDLLRRVSMLLRSPDGKALLAISFATDPESIEARRIYWRMRLAAAATIVERAAARGEISPEIDAKEVIESLIAPFFFRALVSMQPIQGWPFEQMVDRLIAANAQLSGRPPSGERDAPV